MGQHRRKKSGPRRLLAPSLFTALSAVVVAAVVTGTHGLDLSDATAAGKAARSTRAAVAPGSGPTTAEPASPAPVVAPTPSEIPTAADTPTDSPAPTASAAPDTRRAALGTTAPAPAGDPETATVGALFTGSVGAGNHFCTASVLHSATGNLLLTAAHCLNSTDGVTFAPGYRDGSAPYGTWQVTAIHTTAGWSQKGDVDEDFAILETAPNNGRKVEDVVGGNRLGADEPFDATVRLYGYPADSETPNLCTNTTGRQGSYQRVIECPSYPGGTSGGPWISTATGDVVGAIGGYQQGGDTDDVSYSAYFDHTIATLYIQAEASAS
ncbi:trypsin-like peptidase [Streptomyces sp. 1114.5]|uniref:trypsin-like serine peptidase n=1 Tax=unclassified Streptomyces TaxID=2593676 RepID=UPI000BC46193|nr:MULTISPECIES: trypsin-like peptidase domain-containing protein [unclassified Streptomyces]RKT15914.1 trypsin-like peptidase [Streptomyces sp. 1114.5]SOB82088.1 Trypsin-like peptidase domain-containing protein [Streptomyces sp. 1331.2]